MIRRLGQACLGLVFVTGGADSVRRPHERARKAERLGIAARLGTDEVTLVRANGAAMVAGGLALVTDHVPRVAAAGLAASLVPTTLAGHRFWAESDPVAKANQRLHFVKNVSILGGCLLLATRPRGRRRERPAKTADPE
jgi:uncharacterized membrane protein YphA (DoxX/SURF4 family)